MKIKEIKENLFLITFPNQFEMCFTFLRLQEFYESPIKSLRNNYFTLEKAISDYAYLKNEDKKKGHFTYLDDWNGFNVPGNKVLEFYAEFEKDLIKREKQLFDLIFENISGNDFYIIGSVEGEEDIIHHECAHGLYYLNEEYRKKMLKLINPKLRMIKTTKVYLLNNGYHKDVLDDEIQAYFSTGIMNGMIEKKDMDRKYLNKFKKIFKEYYNGNNLS